MLHLKNFTAILIIALFGITMGVEVFAAHSDPFACEGEAHLTDDSSSSAEMKVTDTGATANNDCADPCHFGQCHFGHCSFSFNENSVRFHAHDRLVKPYRKLNSEFVAPVLEGLRRPPRTA